MGGIPRENRVDDGCVGVAWGPSSTWNDGWSVEMQWQRQDYEQRCNALPMMAENVLLYFENFDLSLAVCRRLHHAGPGNCRDLIYSHNTMK